MTSGHFFKVDQKKSKQAGRKKQHEGNGSKGRSKKQPKKQPKKQAEKGRKTKSKKTQKKNNEEDIKAEKQRDLTVAEVARVWFSNGQAEYFASDCVIS